MSRSLKSNIKFKIKSFCYDESAIKRILFTIEINSTTGEMRQYADEIAANPNWRDEFSDRDVKLILYALKVVEG